MERSGVPDGLAEAAGLEEAGVEGGRAGDGEVGAADERRVVRLRRRRQRQPELLGCMCGT